MARSRVIGICACCKHNESVDIDEKLVSIRFEMLKWLISARDITFSVLSACGLSTTPTQLEYTNATAHAQAQCRKGSSNHYNNGITKCSREL